MLIFTIICIIIICIKYWRYIRPKWYKIIYKKLIQLEGFKYSHLTNQDELAQLTQPISGTNCHMLIYGSSASGKTFFLKHYLTQIAELRDSFRKRSCIVFGRDENEFPASNFVNACCS